MITIKAPIKPKATTPSTTPGTPFQEIFQTPSYQASQILSPEATQQQTTTIKPTAPPIVQDQIATTPSFTSPTPFQKIFQTPSYIAQQKLTEQERQKKIQLTRLVLQNLAQQRLGQIGGKATLPGGYLPRTTYLPGWQGTNITARDVLTVAMSNKYRNFANPIEAAKRDLLLARTRRMNISERIKTIDGFEIPSSEYGIYDVVTKNYPVTNESGQVVPGYLYEYSPKTKHMINIAGSEKNYNEYLKQIRDKPEFMYIFYAFQGGKGVGPLDIIPTFGVDIALASDKTTIGGASEREEALIRWLHSVKGSPDAGPTVENIGGAMIRSPTVQIALMSLITPLLVKTGTILTKTAVKGAPKIFSKLPIPSKNVVSKLITATEKFGGASGQSILQRQIPKNIYRWAVEGYKPAIQTTTRVIASQQTIKKLFTGPKATSYIDDVGNVVLKGTGKQIGYIDDFGRTILFKPKRTYGFLERTFISPEQTKKYSELLAKGITTEADVIARGTSGKNPWVQLQAIFEQSQYKAPKLFRSIRGVKYPYRSAELNIRLSSYPEFLPDELLLTESEAAQKAILKGTTPGKQYGSLYNVQPKSYMGFGGEQTPKLAKGLGPEFLTTQKLPGALSVASKKQINAFMKNIWAGKKWNPFTQQWDEAASSLILQPSRKILSLEEKAIIEQFTRGGEVIGKGVSKTIAPQFLIPIEQQLGFYPFLSFLGFRPMVYKPKTRTDVIKITHPEKQYNKIVAAIKKQQQNLKDFTDQQKILDQQQREVIGQMQEQMQSQAQAFKTPPVTESESIYEYPFVPKAPSRQPPPPRDGYVPMPIPPFIWFKPMGGKIAGKGEAEPYRVKYYNEYEMIQQLLRRVIF